MSPRAKTPEQIARAKAKAARREADRRLFLAWLANSGFPAAQWELKFDTENDRDWRFDWAWPEAKVALEIQGGTFVNGRHSRGPALRKEYEKLNAAIVQGWVVIHTLAGEVMTNATARTLRRLLVERTPKETP